MTTPARKAALVTGASRGIGLEIARTLANEGFDLTISARSAGPLQAAQESLSRGGANVVAVPADIRADDALAELASAHEAAYDRLDVLVLSAGSGTAGDLDSYPPESFDRQLATNAGSAFRLVQRLLPLLRRTAAAPDRAQGAKVVAVASITGVVAEPGLAAYGASKAALISLCESITVAESAGGVSATSVCPGYVDTDMASWVHDRVDPATMIRPQDVDEIALALTRLSRTTCVPNVVMTRAGETLWRA